jgi:cob(I)alamin adenosyltransferase
MDAKENHVNSEDKLMGTIFLYTGYGAGKTTNALGLALRCVGHKLKVIIIQFMKGRRDIGEYLIKDRLGPEYEIYQFGSTEYITLVNPSMEDKGIAKKGLEFAKEVLKKKPHLLVLDELNLAAAIGLLDKKEILDFLKQVPKETDVVLTGRMAPSWLIDKADIVNLVAEVKTPKKMYNRIGINY